MELMGNVYQLISRPSTISRGVGFEYVCEKLKGVYSMMSKVENKFIFVNDPYGFRSLVMGTNDGITVKDKEDKIANSKHEIVKTLGFKWNWVLPYMILYRCRLYGEISMICLVFDQMALQDVYMVKILEIKALFNRNE